MHVNVFSFDSKPKEPLPIDEQGSYHDQLFSQIIHQFRSKLLIAR
jgi:hypothetical protein